ncbi:Glucose N-acetyltransferase 1 [Fusarium falciforme]|uniref:Glucose N-acetyltransferase 1 n=1 Tax=Fusarium falciforme TaxID=195108 RepID=UPI002300EEC2|nr:Glucose N-acetyltransferase 1 [Fusarium falciforme]WAO89050.1 Glucose N-acetyltransferase 1 [Fusarium falciforme]
MGWQLSLSSQLSRYLSQAVDMSAETTAPLSPSRFMASKRYRWTALAALLTIFFVFFLVQNHDSLPQRLPQGIPSTYTYTGGDVDWSRFAYTQYVTNSEYLCNSVMFFESLHRLSSKADRVMMFPSRMLKGEDDESSDARLLIKARDSYNVKLVPITIQHRDNADSTWADSFTKLLAFNQTQYSRVLSIDSDSMLLQPMDELFLLPSVPVAMPRAYWLWPDKEILSSQVVLIEPSDVEFKRIQDKIQAASGDDYDMEIVNYLYRESALVLPHRRYDLLTGEFRGDNHSKYLGSDVEVWDPAAAYSEAKLVHFSDWPLPKPWLPTPEDVRIKIQPDCKNTTEGIEDCTARIIWNSFYTDFKTKREEVCGEDKL